jgi:hypothetical protein
MGEQLRKIRLPGVLAIAIWTDLLASRGLLPVTSLLLYLLSMILILRLRRFFRLLREKPFYTEYPWRRMAVRLLTRSMPLLGSVLFFYIFFQARRLFDTVPGIQEMFSLLIVWLFTKWGLNFITLQAQQDPQLLPTAWVLRLKRLLRLIRYFAAVYLVLAWLVGSGGVLLMVVRIAFEAALIVWIFRFRPQFRAHPMPGVAPAVWAEAAAPDIFGTGPHHFYHRPGSRTGRLRRAVTVLVHVMGGNGNGPFLGSAFIPDPTGRRPAILQGKHHPPRPPLTGPHSLSAGRCSSSSGCCGASCWSLPWSWPGAVPRQFSQAWRRFSDSPSALEIPASPCGVFSQPP